MFVLSLSLSLRLFLLKRVSSASTTLFLHSTQHKHLCCNASQMITNKLDPPSEKSRFHCRDALSYWSSIIQVQISTHEGRWGKDGCVAPQAVPKFRSRISEDSSNSISLLCISWLLVVVKHLRFVTVGGAKGYKTLEISKVLEARLFRAEHANSCILKSIRSWTGSQCTVDKIGLPC